MLYDELITEEDRQEAQGETWKIETDQQAEWWIKKHQFELKDIERNKGLVDEEIRLLNEKKLELTQKADAVNASMQAKLIEYFESLPDDTKKATKTQVKYTLPSLNIIRKSQAPEIVQGDEFLKYLKQNHTDYIQVVEKPKWGEFKKLTEVKDGRVINKETGEIVEGLSVYERPDKYEFKCL